MTDSPATPAAQIPAARAPQGKPIHAIIPAGGAGTRLWPLSRRERPKFLLDLTGAGRTLLQGTVARLEPVAATTTIVTGTAHVEAVAAQLPGVPAESILAEPSPRDSMAAIGLAAAVIAHRHGPGAVVGSFAADQTIADEAAFTGAVRQAAALAEEGWLVTIGIEATHPSTAFGYIRSGEPTGVPGAPDGRVVLGFTEKPDAATAAEYLATGEYRWNAGMFVVRSGTSSARESKPPTSSQPMAAGTVATPPAAATGSAMAWSMAILSRPGQRSARTSSRAGVSQAAAMAPTSAASRGL